MKRVIAVLIVILLIASAVFIAINYEKEPEDEEELDLIIEGDTITEEFAFSYPTFSEYLGYTCVHVEEADFYDIHDMWPVLPVKTTTYEFPFGTKILDVIYEHPEPEIISLTNKISVGSCSTHSTEDESVYESDDPFPSSFVSYKTGGGLSDGEYKTFLTVKINPITYRPADFELDFIDQAKFTVVYEEPEYPILIDREKKDLLIITVSDFKKPLDKLVKHKEKMGIKTKLVTLNDIKDTEGRDTQEKMKYYIKESIEELGIKYVLLVGGIKGQSKKWNLPIRYSHVVITENKQESIEPEFISDLYFADIYDSEGNFSSWDTNNNDVFGEWDGSVEIDEMDLYPDVYLGRLPCRNKRQVRIVVDKIINYEKKKADNKWFKKIILISGDHWKDPGHISEGVLIMDEAAEIMEGFTPVKVYATEKNKVYIRDINGPINDGAGFLYFSGHGGATAWGVRYPPDCTGTAPVVTKFEITKYYRNSHMNYLFNGKKLPITVVGGCYNGQFDISISKNGLGNSNCWAWKLTSKKWGGSIATIANTALGTHAMNDADQDDVNDYLEVLDGWLELRFFQLYSYEQVDMLGDLHSGAIKDYLHTFINSGDEMDLKMVQQWELFGDPSLKVGGY